ncbi:hypothetical protein AKJ38_01245 [candidate division MSBL1 archaeon SCGC-AAA259I14]|uniref:Uncharacterized protein n=1 Tax=candidate division MSBL1 archaeon SCGC-AAA259I14 TaxID=1698268 RepID=A0A133UT75_9EURY|nr:hypothetical protein AKJ38_01245 [candidate division MSBL1 archaeon SCGC-AAA259I14]
MSHEVLCDVVDPFFFLSEFIGNFDTKRLGLRLQDIDEYDLPIETKKYSEKELTEIENMVKRGEMTKEEAEFFKKNQRVEVNALRPTELEEYLTKRLEEEGVEKVKPEEEDIEETEIPDPEQVKKDAKNKAIGRYIMSEAGDEIRDAIEEEKLEYDKDPENELKDMRDEGKEGRHQEILNKLEGKPPRLWKDIDKGLKKDKESKAKSKKKDLDSEVVKSVREWCEENIEEIKLIFKDKE